MAYHIFTCRSTDTHSKSSNGPSKKDSTTQKGMQKGANFGTTLLLLYHTSDWLKKQNLPKLQVAVHLFILQIDRLFSIQQNLFSV